MKGSIPSVFKFKQEPPKKKRKSPKKRYFEPETVTESDSFTDASSDSDDHSDHSEKLFKNVNYVKNATHTCDSCNLLKIERDGLKKENERLWGDFPQKIKQLLNSFLGRSELRR